MVNIVARSTTVGATLSQAGVGSVLAQSGAGAKLANMASDQGFTPLELMDAALAGCLVLSVRIAVRKFGWQERFTSVDVDVTHEKAPDGPSRVAGFACSFRIEGDFDAAERQELIAEAHEICTVGNTFEHGAIVRDVTPMI
ncbi:OsmC family protein [Devosia rhodophyticola]|uniref:OsmC family protein n=1 Tax=Devosia rhodophyticola TaxID=3026423 RepID=A0ABY7Z1D0_9HYPH|nr:OsmC family protein [Devosia rhodophyticola]WDR07093.1 OsmC family protein [Devosia rhodophyticola]